MGIFVYPHDCTDFSTTGLCGDLQPIEAYFEEEKNGISQIEMTLQYDELGKWKEAKVGRYISALVPVRVVPAIENDSYSTTIQKIRVKSGTRKVYVDKTCKKVLYIYKDLNGMYAHKELDIDPEGWLAKRYVAIGLGEIVTGTTRAYMYQDDYEIIEQVEIPPALDGVESVTGTARLKPQFFIITSVEQTLEGMIVTAKHVFYELLANATTYKTENTVQGAAACRQVFDNLISADDRFEIYSDCKDEQSGLDYDRVSPVQALLDPDEGICAKYGLSLIRDNYSIYALKNVGTDRGFVVEYGKNMLSVDCIENIDETYTRIIPFGKDKKGNAVYMDGKKWVDSERINDYPAPRVLVLDCTDTASESGDMNLSQVKAELKRRAEEELANGIDKPNLEMTVDFLSLGDTEEYKQYRGLDKVYMFDRITVKDKVRGYNYTAEVVAVRHNLLTGMLESCTIGSLETASAARKIASWQVPTVDGGNIRLQSIVPGILGADAVATDNIQDNAVVAEKINAKAVTAEKINAGAVTAEKVDAGAITAEKIAADAITTDKIAAGAVKADNIDAQAVTAAKLAAGAVTANAIKAGSVTTEKIAAGAVTAESGILAAGVVGTAQIADGSITDAKIVGLTASKITAGTINAAEININNLNADNITAGTINGQRIPTLGGDKIEDGAISGVKIVNGAIVTDKIANGAVTAAKIVAEAVTTDKLAANAVTANKILSGAVTTDKLSANAVTADKIAANTITANKLASDVGSSLDLSSNQSINLTVKKAVDDIEIGGRNLFKGHKEEEEHPLGNYFDGIGSFSQYRNLTFDPKDTVGETYTVSFWAKSPNGLTKLWFYNNNSDPRYFQFYCSGNTVDASWKFFSYTFRNEDRGESHSIDDYKKIEIFAPDRQGVLVKKIKIEKGNKATDWTAAPEDIEERVSEAEAEIAVQDEEIKLRAKQTEVDKLTGRITDAEAQIVTQAGEIQMAVTEVSNISIGGTNILPGYADERTTNRYIGIPCRDILEAHVGENICVSFECKATTARALRLYPYQNLGISIDRHVTFIPSTTEFTRHAFVFKVKAWPEAGERYEGNTISIYDDAGYQNFTIRKFKIELGNKPTDWSPCPDDPVKTLKNTAMTLNADGIEMTTTGHFRLYANDGKNSRIKLGGDNSTANFSVDESGMLGAISGDFAQGLSVGNQPVWTRGNIIISSNQPTGVHDVLWIQPMQGVQQTSHSYLNTSQDHFTGGNAMNFTLAPDSASVLSSGGSYSYSLSLRMTLGQDTTTVKDFTISAVLSTGAGSVTLTGQSVSLTGWKNVNLTLTGTSGVNLCASSGNITAAVTVSGNIGNTYMYIPRNTSLILTSKNTAASSAGAQTCTIHYIQ